MVGEDYGAGYCLTRFFPYGTVCESIPQGMGSLSGELHALSNQDRAGATGGLAMRQGMQRGVCRGSMGNCVYLGQRTLVRRKS